MATTRRSPSSARKRLGTYRAKRDFTLTSEPAPEARAPRGGESLMVVHKHDATRLHYDLRLEIDGVLVSWAIPKGPSHDPADKRLAVRTEDHPLAYASFEGRIPDGAYGAGDSLLWESGTFDTVPPGEASEQLARGRLHVALHGQKLEGEWHLIRTRGQGPKEQWLCFKAKDGTERSGDDVTEAHPESVKSGQRVTHGPGRRTRRAASKRRTPSTHSPGWVVFALDPGEGTFEDLIVLATSLRRHLEDQGLMGVPKTSPLAWSDVTRKLDPTRYTLATVRRRLDKVGDLFAPALAGRQRLPRC